MAGIEEYHRLDIRYLHKVGGLRAGLSYSWKWTRGGEPSGNIQINVENDCLILCYCLTRDGKSEDVRERVCLDWTSCNYGRERPWFLCPGCGRRVGILALGGKLFLCRHCYRLKYWSQLETDLDRANRKVQKLKERLGEKEWLKPKGMHQKTFDRLHSELLDAEIKADELFVIGAAKIMMRSQSANSRLFRSM